MFNVLFAVSIIGAFVQGIKESVEPTIPAENWENKELYHNDVVNGVSAKQRMKNAKNGKYKLTKKYPEPHRDTTNGKIVVENCKLYHEDMIRYGSYQTMKWVEQGKYNLTPEELAKERKRYKEKFKYL